MNKETITVETLIDAPLEKIWEYWTDPKHIVKWTTASDDWHTPKATNDLRPGGKFLTRMEAKDGSFGFDFEGVYAVVEPHKKIEYDMADGRNVKVTFEKQNDKYKVIESFHAEDTNPIEMQKAGWQAILDNFKTYVEAPM